MNLSHQFGDLEGNEEKQGLSKYVSGKITPAQGALGCFRVTGLVKGT